MVFFLRGKMFLNEVTYFSIASIFAGLVFIAVGIWAFCRKIPMHFWSGTTVSPETITDVKKRFTFRV